jgi:NaMN:DMB phosphoribosyltransferase
MLRSLIPIAVAVACAAPAAALDLPPRKPGLWDIRMAMEGRSLPAMNAQHCIDAETDKLLNVTGAEMTRGMCSRQDVQKVGDTYVIDAVCKFGPANTTTKSVVTGSFDSAYTVKVSSSSEGGPAPGKSEMTIEARWAGPCQSGQKPGDIIMPTGMKMNVRDLQKIQSLMPK